MQLVRLKSSEAQKILGANKNVNEIPDKWFSCKINFITINEKTDKEKKTAFRLLVHANTVDAAHELVVVHMKDSMSDYSIEKIDETTIMDVYEYEGVKK